MPFDPQELLKVLDGALRFERNEVRVVDEARLRQKVEDLVEISALETGPRQGWARYLVRMAALELGIVPCSIHEVYMARGRGEIPPTFTVPALNLRVLPFFGARAAFRVAQELNAAAVIFEIARSEIGYTAQRPAEYATAILAAAIAEGWRGQVFIQGDHFQVSARRYATSPEEELHAVRELTREAIHAGFFNIDIDTSTLVDIHKPDLDEQQKLNYQLSAAFSAFIREIEPPGVTVSIGGEIGEVGGHNSTEPELRAFMEGYRNELARYTTRPGLSKISIQTGTSHGGVILPDGRIAEVEVDFETLRTLSRVARQDYGLAGAVQHGASTLPEEAFGKFVESEACEVHLATNFMNIFFDLMPQELRQEMYAWLDVNALGERKAGMSDAQFYYKTRKNALGPFKAQIYALPAEVKERLSQAWEAQFRRLFPALGLRDTRPIIERYACPMLITPRLSDYVVEAATTEDVSDLAD
uniref:Aldolase n=1 Tax=uncultured Chloroflexota bacterium TaxID=166587 RepID=H5SLB9_9CHLR|nr:aldolase [uncultured Chloroflexota bacterium]